jgi:hypothetical protein
VNDFNRLFWLVAGVFATGAGILGFGATYDWWSGSTINRAIPFRDVWQEWRDIDWSLAQVRWLLLMVAVVVACASAAMAARQLLWGDTHERADALVVEQSERGRTTLSRASLARGAAAEARATGGVEDVRVDRIAVTTEGVRARYRLTVDGAEDVRRVGAAVVDRGGRSLAQTLDRAQRHVTAEIVLRHARNEREVR